MLGQAKARGILTPEGEQLRKEISMVLESLDDQLGRLTPIGYREHREIAGRMFRRYSNVFRGKGTVNVISSVVPRCIMSMSAFTGRLEELNGDLQINMDCGEVIQRLVDNEASERTRKAVQAVRDSLYAADIPDYSGMMSTLFTNPDAARAIIRNPETFARDIASAGRISRSYGYTFNLHRVLPFEAVYRFTDINNVYMYIYQCNSLAFGEPRMAQIQPLVWDVVEKADAAIAGNGVRADLRFGHDYPLLSLSSFLGLEGIGESYSIEDARKHIDIGLQSPFAGNLQLIFYKAPGKPVLVKFLLNETERRIYDLPSFSGPYYRWDDVKDYLDNKCAARFIGPLQGRGYRESKKKEAYQGMDIWGDYLLSCQNAGAAAVYRIDGDRMVKQGDFLLGSADKLNHCNVASFLPDFYDSADPLPLVLVSLCNRQRHEGMKDQGYIERIAPDFSCSQLVATINYDDAGGDFGYALQWVVDRRNRMLYGYGNTIDNSSPGNKHRVMKFALPEIKGEEGQVITLRAADALENYLIEDYCSEPFMPIGQGLFVEDGKLYMPTGLDTVEQPSILYVWNLDTRTMEHYDTGLYTYGEPEDCSRRNGKLWLQTQKGIFRIDNLK